MRVSRSVLLGFSAAAAAFTLSACERQAAKPARDAADVAQDARPGSDGGYNNDGRDDRRGDRAGRGGGGRADAGPRHSDGTPMWAGNRRRSPDEQARAQFERNGADFGATSQQAYVDKVHAFVSSPPAGVLTATRGNGDKLIYDARTNTFAVVSRRGAPRTMFKPRDGREYWTRQLARLDEYGQGRGANRNRNRGGDRAVADRGGSDDDAG